MLTSSTALVFPTPRFDPGTIACKRESGLARFHHHLHHSPRRPFIFLRNGFSSELEAIFCYRIRRDHLTRLHAYQGITPEDDHNVTEKDMWQRVQLLQRSLDVLIAEEDYLQAKKISDQLTSLKAQLPEAEQLLLEKVHSLGKGSVSERIRIITDLGNIGDMRVLPILSHGLFDKNPVIASEVEKAMWKLFMYSGRADVDQYLQQGLSLMLSNNLLRAKDIFTQVIEMSPSFAEGWNKRATVHYLLKDYHASIKDCEQTLKLNPYHFGALSGNVLQKCDDHSHLKK